MVVMPVDVPTCVEYKWGSMFAEMYYEHAQHAVMGPCEFQDHIVLRIERYS
ncbi:hypothetical protein DPMN_150769 [Dreissena polymorpha]|uniref:Uncharacterized protein n=1 Tax=Dreissena polymorpha TaxID=45954 RepID=A0A9D4EWB5_DREPO|nr:hypothetical protein DPMN_163202 [Dreissena polymorpha]KAH3797193.1 hypothetical protein DPMN_150769 [Dreissena polymorpha]